MLASFFPANPIIDSWDLKIWKRFVGDNSKTGPWLYQPGTSSRRDSIYQRRL